MSITEIQEKELAERLSRTPEEIRQMSRDTLLTLFIGELRYQHDQKMRERDVEARLTSSSNDIAVKICGRCGTVRMGRL